METMPVSVQNIAFRLNMISSENINYRSAKLEDKRAITEISYDVYDGVDHTVSCFSKWLADETWFLFVAENEDKVVVAFTAQHLTDGGARVVTRSSRVAKVYKGRGIIEALKSYAYLHVKKCTPHVEKVMSLRSVEEKPPKASYRSLKS